MNRSAALVCAAGLVAACPAAPEADAPAYGRMVLLSVQNGPRDSSDPIQGGVSCGDEGMPPLPPCLASDLALAEAVLACGPAEATVDRGGSHMLLVKFPAGTRERFPASPSDVDIVRCVQGRVGFSFSAGIETGPDGMPAGDQTPFEALHSKRPKAK